MYVRLHILLLQLQSSCFSLRLQSYYVSWDATANIITLCWLILFLRSKVKATRNLTNSPSLPLAGSELMIYQAAHFSPKGWTHIQNIKPLTETHVEAIWDPHPLLPKSSESFNLALWPMIYSIHCHTSSFFTAPNSLPACLCAEMWKNNFKE